jgi:hypothetical protein
MSFLRHQEIYQVSEHRFGARELKRARPCGYALAHRLDESPVGYSWRVALQQSPLPLRQPAATLRQSSGEMQDSIRWFIDPNLTCGLTSGVHPRYRFTNTLNPHYSRKHSRTPLPLS